MSCSKQFRAPGMARLAQHRATCVSAARRRRKLVETMGILETADQIAPCALCGSFFQNRELVRETLTQTLTITLSLYPHPYPESIHFQDAVLFRQSVFAKFVAF